MNKRFYQKNAGNFHINQINDGNFYNKIIYCCNNFTFISKTIIAKIKNRIILLTLSQQIVMHNTFFTGKIKGHFLLYMREMI